MRKVHMGNECNSGGGDWWVESSVELKLKCGDCNYSQNNQFEERHLNAVNFKPHTKHTHTASSSAV